MAAIIRNIINQAFQLPGIIGVDEVAEGTAAQLAVIKLNELIAQLNVQQLFPYSQRVLQFSPTASKQSYTIGTPYTVGDAPADIVEERPCFINRILYYPQGLSSPLNVQHLDLPDLLGARSTLNVSGTPNYFALNGSYPYAEILLDVAPVAGCTFQIVYNASIPPVTIASTLMTPPEYNDVLVTGLSRKLCALYQLPAETLQTVDILYQSALDVIKSSNGRNQVPTLDSMYGIGRESLYTYSARTDNY